MCNNTYTASYWPALLAILLFVLIHLLIATKMTSFGDATFTFKTDSAFDFEINNKIQISAKGKGERS